MSNTPQSAPRDSDRLLGVPRSMWRSHGRTQDELYRAAVPPAAGRWQKLGKFLRVKWFAWVWHYLKSRLGGKYPFAVYDDAGGDSGIYELTDGRAHSGPVTVALVADWGTGSREAYEVGQLVARRQPHFTIHLGDVYYVGTKDEIRGNMLGGRVRWPTGSMGSFSLNSNHEMYARGKGYFKHLLPALGPAASSGGSLTGQKASYFCLRNAHWLVIGLDTGYYSVGLPIIEKILKPSCKLHRQLVRWLREVVRLQDDRHRGIVLLSHHQYYSEFESLHEKAARQLSALVDRPVLWFWGHEHRFAVYAKRGTAAGRTEAYGRCIGHGGMPIEDIADAPKTGRKHRNGLVFYDRRERTKLGDRAVPVGFNGFAHLTFDGDRLEVTYVDAAGVTVLEESWTVDGEGRLAGQSIQAVADPDLVQYQGRSLRDAIS